MPKRSFFALWKLYRAYFVTTILIFICIVSFQNCTPEVEETGSEENSSLSDSTPFAFDVSIDHFALMTCPTVGLNHDNSKGQFTYKWGAYQNGLAAPGKSGLSFSENFLQRYGDDVSARVFTVLQDSIKNKDLEIVGGLYEGKNYLSRRLVESSKDLYINDHNKLLVNFYMLDLSLNLKKTLSYFPSVDLASGLYRNIEGMMLRRSTKNLSELNGFFDEFNAVLSHDRLKALPLTLGFSHSSNLTGINKPLVSEDGSYVVGSAVGRSYRPSFSGIYNNINRIRFLSNITEQSTSGERLNSFWSCPSYLQFKIVERAALTDEKINVTCNPRLILPSELKSQDTRGKSLRSLANVLDLSVWEVDYDNKCIVRRGANSKGDDNCYSSDYNRFIGDDGQVDRTITHSEIDYNLTKCASNNPVVTNGQIKTFYMCPHYVSLCVKRN